MADKLWIQNGYRSAIEIVVKDDKSLEDEHFVFQNYKMDRITERVVSDGYTCIDKEVYDKLMSKSGAFKRLIGDGTLIMYTEAPLSAMSDVDRILLLQEEVRTLKEENAKLKTELETKSAKKSEEKTEVKPASKKSSDK